MADPSADPLAHFRAMMQHYKKVLGKRPMLSEFANAIEFLLQEHSYRKAQAPKYGAPISRDELHSALLGPCEPPMPDSAIEEIFGPEKEEEVFFLPSDSDGEETVEVEVEVGPSADDDSDYEYELDLSELPPEKPEFATSTGSVKSITKVGNWSVRPVDADAELKERAASEKALKKTVKKKVKKMGDAAARSRTASVLSSSSPEATVPAGLVKTLRNSDQPSFEINLILKE